MAEAAGRVRSATPCSDYALRCPAFRKCHAQPAASEGSVDEREQTSDDAALQALLGKQHLLRPSVGSIRDLGLVMLLATPCRTKDFALLLTYR